MTQGRMFRGTDGRSGEPMAAIELIRVTKTWGATVAVRDISFEVDEGSFVVLLGPSGCGKSTTLRMIAGLDDVTSGRVLIGGEEMTGAPPAARRVSMVFQSYALFPHLDVTENILFGLKARKVAKADQSERLVRVAEMVGLADLLDRKPAQLSGGQRQRVALARAIIAENPICLMDEPLSNLDAKLRHEMRVEIRALQQRLGMTTIYVTHDQTEAMSMADQVVLMRDGAIEQQGPPAALYDRPETVFAAGFIGTPPMNLLKVEEAGPAMVIAGTQGPAVAEAGHGNLVMGVRPEMIAITDGPGIEGRVESCDYLGADTIVGVRVGSQPVLVRAQGRHSLAAGSRIHLHWQESEVHLFDDATGVRTAGARPLPVAA